MYIRKPRISGAVLVEARSMTYGDLGAKEIGRASCRERVYGLV